MKQLTLCLFSLLFASVGVQGATITVSPTTQNANTGSQFVIDLRIFGLGNGSAPSVGTFAPAISNAGGICLNWRSRQESRRTI